MSRRTILIAATSVLVVVAIAVAAGSLGWSGALHERALSGGDSVDLESGLRLTIPTGWSGHYTKYAWSPTWLPLGDADLHRSEYLSLTGPSRDAIPVMFVTYYRNGHPAPSGPVIGSTADAEVFGPQDPGAAAIVRTRLSDHRPGVVFIGEASGEPVAAAREVWAAFEITGAELP